ncbi:hypothetical protein DFJ74DRAFT_186080 [Hyaloraphidium curvatum]|nr:hypothetical protein DFJ74DRAFT_186080 [Hyaloraphidium curvatum]
MAPRQKRRAEGAGSGFANEAMAAACEELNTVLGLASDAKLPSGKAGRSLRDKPGKAALGEFAGRAGVGMAAFVWDRIQAGDKDFVSVIRDDCLKIGFGGLEAGAPGVLSGEDIFGMSKFAETNAPFAGAVVGAGKAVFTLAASYIKGGIDADQFMEMGCAACVDAAAIGVGTVLGQALIPIPYVGGYLGRVAADFFVRYIKDQMDEGTMEEIRARLDKRIEPAISALGRDHREKLQRMERELQRLFDLTQRAFDLRQPAHRINLASLELAMAYGVDETKLVRTHVDLDRFLGYEPRTPKKKSRCDTM